MTEDLSEEAMKSNCWHCDKTSQAFSFPLEETEHFYILCDSHAMVEGHVLIIPKEHLAGIGEFTEELLAKYEPLHRRVTKFVKATYGSVSVFEHGKLGQTVFHSHIHFIPFAGKPTDIVPEGLDKLKKLSDLAELIEIFNRDGGYLFFGIEDEMWTVDSSLAVPRFFRDRFAKALGVPERGNWKEMHHDPAVMKTVKEMNAATLLKWRRYHEKNS